VIAKWCRPPVTPQSCRLESVSDEPWACSLCGWQIKLATELSSRAGQRGRQLTCWTKRRGMGYMNRLPNSNVARQTVACRPNYSDGTRRHESPASDATLAQATLITMPPESSMMSKRGHSKVNRGEPNRIHGREAWRTQVRQ